VPADTKAKVVDLVCIVDGILKANPTSRHMTAGLSAKLDDEGVEHGFNLRAPSKPPFVVQDPKPFRNAIQRALQADRRFLYGLTIRCSRVDPGGAWRLETNLFPRADWHAILEERSGLDRAIHNELRQLVAGKAFKLVAFGLGRNPAAAGTPELRLRIAGQPATSPSASRTMKDIYEKTMALYRRVDIELVTCEWTLYAKDYGDEGTPEMFQFDEYFE
jgi:hypothetical protein